MPVDDDWLKKLGLVVGGGLFGAFLLQSHHDEKKKSRAEKEDPDGCKELYNTVSETLDRWEPPDFNYEDESLLSKTARRRRAVVASKRLLTRA